MFGDEEIINVEELANELLDRYGLQGTLELAGIEEVDLMKYLIIEGLVNAEEILRD